MYRKILCLCLLLGIITRCAFYFSNTYKESNKEEIVPVSVVESKKERGVDEFILEFKEFGSNVNKMFKDGKGWRVDLEYIGSDKDIESLLKSISNYEILSYNLLLIEEGLKLSMQVYCE